MLSLGDAEAQNNIFILNFEVHQGGEIWIQNMPKFAL